MRFTKIISVYHIADRNFFKSCLVKWALSEEEGRETETLYLLSACAASGQVYLDNPIPIHQVHSHRRCDEQKLP